MVGAQTVQETRDLKYGVATNSTLQDGMATNSTLQNGVPGQLPWIFFIHNDFDISSKNGQTFAFMRQKNSRAIL